MTLISINSYRPTFLKMLDKSIQTIYHIREQVKAISWFPVKTEEELICERDGKKIDCVELQEDYDEGESFKQDAINYYTGVPAPAYLPDDDWFGPAPIRSEKQLDYMAIETEWKIQEQKEREESGIVEQEDIHKQLYEIASQNWNTVSEFQGGSENFHEGPSGWQSGAGR